jgi:integrase
MGNLTFEQHLIRRGLQPVTVRGRLDCYQILLRHNALDEESARSFLWELKSKGRKGTYLNILLLALRAYWDFQGRGVPNIEFFKEEEAIKATLSDEEIERIINLKPLCKGKRYRERWDRWTLFFKIMAYTGMRPGEVAKLGRDNCDFGRSVFILEQTKTDPRLVPIPPAVIKSLLHGLELSPHDRKWS